MGAKDQINGQQRRSAVPDAGHRRQRCATSAPIFGEFQDRDPRMTQGKREEFLKPPWEESLAASPSRYKAPERNCEGWLCDWSVVAGTPREQPE